MNTPEHSRHHALPSVLEWLVIVTFIVFLITPLMGHLLGISNASSIQQYEFRRPHPPPSWPKNPRSLGQLPHVAEAWLNDSFGFRTFFAGLDQFALATIGSSRSESVLVGTSGWLFHRRDRHLNIEAEHRGSVPVDRSEIDRWVAVLAKVRRQLATTNTHLIVAVLPNKQSIYSEYLPKWARQYRANRTDQLCTRILETNVARLIDTRQLLINAKDEYHTPLYYKTDTHWNHYGAFVAYSHIMSAVQEILPEVNVLHENDFQISQSTTEPLDLMRMHNFRWGRVESRTNVVLNRPSHVLYAEELIDSVWKECAIHRSYTNNINVRVRTDLHNAPRVLVVRDSFCDALAPFFNESFSELIYYQPARRDITLQDVYDYRPDLVLYAALEKRFAYRAKIWWGNNRRRKRPAPDQSPDGSDPEHSWVSFFRDGFDDGSSSHWTRVATSAR